MNIITLRKAACIVQTSLGNSALQEFISKNRRLSEPAVFHFTSQSGPDNITHPMTTFWLKSGVVGQQVRVYVRLLSWYRE